jgi:glycosyltransferase involved in cell wall biosynthesis
MNACSSGPRSALEAMAVTRRDVQSRLALRGCNDTRPRDLSPVVSVVMPTYNAEAHVTEAIQSILGQTLRDIELIVVDDASTDGTVGRVLKIAANDARLRVFTCTVNRGPYWARNLGLLHARGHYVANQDADDTSDSERLASQVAALGASSGAVICVTNYQRVDAETGAVVMNRGLPERLSYQSFLFRRAEVLGEVGFYDTVRFAADDEFYHRVMRRFGRHGVSHVRRPLYKAKVVSTSLTFVDRSSLDAHDDPDGHLSPVRRQYVQKYRKWHESTSDLRIPFPMRKRPFSVPAEMLPPDGVVSDDITASIASIPSRQAGLKRVVARLLLQADRLTVFLNGYGAVPDFLKQPRVLVAKSEDHGRLEDNGKFFFEPQIGDSGIHCTVDDDLDYPPDYIARSVAKLLQYGRQAAVGYHGIRIRRSFSSYYDLSSRDVDSYRFELLRDRPAHILGTGTVTYDRSVLHPQLIDFGEPRMADIWFALYARRVGIPFVCASHERGHLREFEDSAVDSIYDAGIRDDRVQTGLIQSAMPWPGPRLPGPLGALVQER